MKKVPRWFNLFRGIIILVCAYILFFQSEKEVSTSDLIIAAVAIILWFVLEWIETLLIRKHNSS
jgi:hypothetical protein